MTSAERLALIAEYRNNQPLAELERKAKRAARRGFYTVEGLEWADAMAAILVKKFVFRDESSHVPATCIERAGK